MSESNVENFDGSVETRYLRVFLDTGLQKRFVPLLKKDSEDVPEGEGVPKSLTEAVKEAEENFNRLSEAARQVLADSEKCEQLKAWRELSKEARHIRYRVGDKTWKVSGGQKFTLCGLWFMIETNTSGHDGNAGAPRYDRGAHYQTHALNKTEKDAAEEAFKKGTAAPRGEQFYIRDKEGDEVDIVIDDKILDLGGLKLTLLVTKPAGVCQDIDVVLDFGNTRSAGLLFEHVGKNAFKPTQFRQVFQILRLDPDPSSGEYAEITDEQAGIADSWIMLHELDSQKFLKEKQSKAPELLQREINTEVKTERVFFRTKYNVTGEVIERIPQMFAEMSPVLIGECARRQLDLPYAHQLMNVGAQIQQSSPKRYYWDDTLRDHDWCMVLNDYDPAYNPELNVAQLPVLQGELFRYIREDGVVGKAGGDTCPEHPRYPRRSTLTWFLLHVLERAYAQSNMSFEGKTFIPHRLRKVLMTYPSGWTKAEVENYRARCQEALDIFTNANVYKGLASEWKLELVPKSLSPDEAVAGQLPVVFSEILRYEGQTADDWIATMGKRRGDRSSVRIMNFDIGGGTTDISVIEYTDANGSAAVNANVLNTQLLFKGGHALAGDDLLKTIIEKLVLAPLMTAVADARTKDGGDLLKNALRKCFTSAAKTASEEAQRAYVVRTCLIPLARYCLSHSDADTSNFSAQDAGIPSDNWNAFVEFVGAKASDIVYDTQIFTCGSDSLAPIVEETFDVLFKNCAKYAAAYDIDMIIFCGKPSELSAVREMAGKYIPLDNERMVFARSFKPGAWYPFLDDNDFIKDAKTMTVVGAALFYALSSGLVTNWTIQSLPSLATERNEWGEYSMMQKKRRVFLEKDADEVVVSLLPKQIIARRQNACSTAEPVYKFVDKLAESRTDPVKQLKCTLARVSDGDGNESLELKAVANYDLAEFELKLWPCGDESGSTFWQDTGIFSL